MRTPEEVTLALKQASGLFTTVVGNTNENDLPEIDDILISISLQVVKFDGTANIQKLFGVVGTDEDYLAKTGQVATFAVPAILSMYYDTIPADTTTATCRSLEAALAEKIGNRGLYEVADAGC